MKHYDMLQKYLANLALMNVKLHNVHWNVVGMQFLKVHNLTEEIYDSFFEAYDEVAELLKMKGVHPASTMAEYLQLTDIEEIKARDFNIKESLEILKNDLVTMRTLATDIRNTADEAGDFETVAMFEDFVAAHSKNIWFLTPILK